MCGIIGIVQSDKRACVNQAIVDALTILQHRGQDAAGIVTASNNRLHMLKNKGTVAEVFVQDNIVTLKGNIGIGHVRYPTAGGGNCSEAQPLYTNYPFGIAISHNGNLTNTDELAEQMRRKYRHINTDSDSEVLLNVFADELQRRQLATITPDDIFDAVQVIMRKCKGGYAVVMLINGLGLLAFRDPHGIRPLCFGSRESATGKHTVCNKKQERILHPSHPAPYAYSYSPGGFRNRLRCGIGECGDRCPRPPRSLPPGQRCAARGGDTVHRRRRSVHHGVRCRCTLHSLHL